MVSKCANPVCSEPFRYLHEGRLFRMEVDPPFAARTEAAGWTDGKKPSRRLEFFWLCDSCASRMTLQSEPGRGVKVVHLARAQRAAS